MGITDCDRGWDRGHTVEECYCDSSNNTFWMLCPAPRAVRPASFQAVNSFKPASFAKIFEQNVDRPDKQEQKLSRGRSLPTNRCLAISYNFFR
ncbi:MAG: hypothetical protein JGK17_10585 [Microcoleus sp. PH2017_10_PVI_O_A]|uniref:hypothetical protein n=1 Tax=unclassified Microcoleus TaxID=2642155 RepID=UPI001E03943B|nr:MULTISPECIES: hypothetical protein [unclassified Microcoleus]MCC3406020.1 hypothetical protein [Microcoleus sp. PH2017_10_PVI_O_A]MCC3463937.1 hypothetical protein [Microcoleus sp. PH2017_11_PCY_U_A]MCC3482263.1 hypothetical protein [Microcoleus sp. PH2017_12_PCY_D_A]MCC3532121.1 hypothetical protein [Microcoleus sp. PH2017_21_RUC_O_A]MCC3544425.1 hypothetical protein [Microcoleus sp. PH2017_22_RUC_O_B]